MNRDVLYVYLFLRECGAVRRAVAPSEVEALCAARLVVGAGRAASLQAASPR